MLGKKGKDEGLALKLESGVRVEESELRSPRFSDGDKVGVGFESHLEIQSQLNVYLVTPDFKE